jgi:aspartate oxidase
VNERPLARALTEEAPARLRELIEVGARFQQRNGSYYLSPSGDHRHPRVLVPEHIRGTDLTLPLRAAVLAPESTCSRTSWWSSCSSTRAASSGRWGSGGIVPSWC